MFIWNHLFKKKEAADEQIKQVHENNKVLTEDEVALVVSTCKELSTMGLGIDEDTCLRVVNGIIQERVDKKDFLEVTRIVVSRILKTNDELLWKSVRKQTHMTLIYNIMFFCE